MNQDTNLTIKCFVSWGAFLHSVEKMRAAQEEYSKKRTPANRDAARKWEGYVDESIKEKNAEAAEEGAA
jgi:hypothetical protein